MRALILTTALLMPPASLRAEEPAAQTFDAKGTKLRYYVAGKGDAVVLIHGLHSSAPINWIKVGVFEAIAKDHQTIAFDLPGHGGSDKPDKEDAYGMQMADDVILLLDHLKVKKAHVVGYSLGGMVAMKTATKHPERVSSLTLGGMGWLREGSALQNVWDKMGAREGLRTPAVCVRSIGKLAVTEEEVRAIKVPAAVIVGDRDPVKRLYVTPLSGVRKDWPVVEIEGAGHLNCIVKPEFKDEIVKWLAKQEKR